MSENLDKCACGLEGKRKGGWLIIGPEGGDLPAIYHPIGSPECIKRQLAQSQERVKELDSENDCYEDRLIEHQEQDKKYEGRIAELEAVVEKLYRDKCLDRDCSGCGWKHGLTCTNKESIPRWKPEAAQAQEGK